MEDVKDGNASRDVPINIAKKLFGLKVMAYKDYLAARVLFNNNMLPQACIYANTCIEKEIKAYLFALVVKFGKDHNTISLYNRLFNNKKEVAEKLNKNFISIINRIYESRYYENLNPNFNFVINRNKFLSELDYTYSILEPTVKYGLVSQSRYMTPLYESDKQSKNPVLFLNNYLLNNIDRSRFLNQPDFVYEFRVVVNHEIFEALYEIPFNKNPEDFKMIALVPSIDGISYTISNHHFNLPPPAVYRNGELLKVKP
jgi:HEPN domain-containing protein